MWAKSEGEKELLDLMEDFRSSEDPDVKMEGTCDWERGRTSRSCTSAGCEPSVVHSAPVQAPRKRRASNVVRLLAYREICPGARRPKSSCWGHSSDGGECCGPGTETHVMQQLRSWVEADSIRNCSGKYTSFNPSPRSTIAASFSPNGQFLASTHGDHTVKIIDCRTGNCLKVLSGHLRTPWVVRFHPACPTVVASGSLDHVVRLWDFNTSESIASHDFFRPIASIAFHAQGDILAVASGHKLFIWQYTKPGEASQPCIILRTRRSLRAVHFHPHGAPLLLTAEVNDLDSNECPPATATMRGLTSYFPSGLGFTPATLAAAAAAAAAVTATTSHQHLYQQHLQQQQQQPHHQQQQQPHHHQQHQRTYQMPQQLVTHSQTPQEVQQGQPHLLLDLYQAQTNVAAPAAAPQPPIPMPWTSWLWPPQPPRTGYAHADPAPPVEPARDQGGAGLWGRVMTSGPAHGPGAVDSTGDVAVSREGQGWLGTSHPQRGGRGSQGGVSDMRQGPGEADGGVLSASSGNGPPQGEAATPMEWAADGIPAAVNAGHGGWGTAGGGEATATGGVEVVGAASAVDPPRARTGVFQTSMATAVAAQSVGLAPPFGGLGPVGGLEPQIGVAPHMVGAAQLRGAAQMGATPQMGGTQMGGFVPMGTTALGPPRGRMPFWEVPGLGAGHVPGLPGGGMGALPQGDGAGDPHPVFPQVSAMSISSMAMAAAIAAARSAAGAGMLGALGNGGAAGEVDLATRGVLAALPRALQGIGPAAEAAAQAALAAAAAAELPCTVKLRLWPHDLQRPTALLDPETCKLTIAHAVLCSEMGSHFSPCGRFLAACVACKPPANETDIFSRTLRSLGGAASSTRHELPAALHEQPGSPPQSTLTPQSVVYELRIYSLEESTFGQVLASRAVRAAHCLTSIQFSPTSEHVLLAYGRRHNTLLRSLVADGNGIIPVYTILEVYRVSDMSLVKVLPSAEDEVNVATFHPSIGGGLVYGTKEGKLRLVCHDRAHLPRIPRMLEDELLEAESMQPYPNTYNGRSTFP